MLILKSGLIEQITEKHQMLYSLKVVNDYTVWGVALIQEHNGLLTKMKNNFSFLMQVVEQHRQMFPDCCKRTLTGVGNSQSSE